jgi:glutaredoxin
MSANSLEYSPGAARITVVTSPACHFCHDALEALQVLGQEFPLEVTELDVRDPLGRDLVARHGAGMSPLVLLDDQFVSAGRMPRGKVRRMLSKRAASLAGARR